jgi:hypothetical protein
VAVQKRVTATAVQDDKRFFHDLATVASNPDDGDKWSVTRFPVICHVSLVTSLQLLHRAAPRGMLSLEVA